jgi:hypothetical protein
MTRRAQKYIQNPIAGARKLQSEGRTRTETVVTCAHENCDCSLHFASRTSNPLPEEFLVKKLAQAGWTSAKRNRIHLCPEHRK